MPLDRSVSSEQMNLVLLKISNKVRLDNIRYSWYLIANSEGLRSTLNDNVFLLKMQRDDVDEKMVHWAQRIANKARASVHRLRISEVEKGLKVGVWWLHRYREIDVYVPPLTYVHDSTFASLPTCFELFLIHDNVKSEKEGSSFHCAPACSRDLI